LLRVGGQAVDHFARAGVVEFLTRFVLDGIRIFLQTFDMLPQVSVLVFQLLTLVFELLLLAALSIPGGEAVAAV